MVTPLVARNHSVVHYFLCYVTLSRNRNDYQPHNHTQVAPQYTLLLLIQAHRQCVALDRLGSVNIALNLKLLNLSDARVWVIKI